MELMNHSQASIGRSLPLIPRPSGTNRTQPLVFPRPWHPLWLATICSTLLFTLRVSAQPVLVPEMESPVIPGGATQTSGEASTTADGESSAGATGPVLAPGSDNPFVWGPLVFHPRAAYTFSYGTGLRSQPGQQERSIVQTLSPSLGIDLGRNWKLFYKPELTFYSSDNLEDTLSHSVSLSGHAATDVWTFSVGQTVSISSEARAETATQTDSKQYSTFLGAGRQLGRDWSLDLGVFQNIQSRSGYEDAQGDTYQWSTMNWLNYHVGPAFGVAGGVGGGFTDVTTGSDMTYEQVQGRITFRVSQKIHAGMNAGVEIRQFVDSEQSDLINPLFGASVSYAPFEQTSLSLKASRSVDSSYFQSQVTETTSVSVGLQQRLFGSYRLNVSGGYSFTEYESSSSDLEVSRSDEGTFFRVSLGNQFLKRGSWSVFYARSENATGLAGYGYTSDQIGFTVSYGY